MKQSFNINFYCRQSKACRNGPAPLELGINANGRRKFINLPYKCPPGDFNRKKQPGELKDYMASMRRRIGILSYMIAAQEPLASEAPVKHIHRRL